MGETRRKFEQDFGEGGPAGAGDRKADRADRQGPGEINKGTLGTWVIHDRRRAGADGRLSDDERAELARLRKENAELAMERDVLKRSGGLWVKDAMGR